MATQESTRYLAFGCSYTNYYWPTYADYLSTCFDEYLNLGAAGAGNRYIFQKLLNVINYQEILSRPLNNQDFITIQWSGLPREDKILPRKNATMYATSGHLGSQGTFPDGYITNFFSLIQSAFELSAYITASKLLLDSLGLKYKMFFMMEPDEHDFLGEVFLTPLQTDEGLFHSDTEKLIDTGMLDKLLSLLPEDIYSVEKFRLLNTIDDELTYYLAHINEDGTSELQEDTHPTPFAHLKYAQYLSTTAAIEDTEPLFKDYSRHFKVMDEYYSKVGRENAIKAGNLDNNNISLDFYPKSKTNTTKFDGDNLLTSTCVNGLLEHNKSIFKPSLRQKLRLI